MKFCEWNFSSSAQNGANGGGPGKIIHYLIYLINKLIYFRNIEVNWISLNNNESLEVTLALISFLIIIIWIL